MSVAAAEQTALLDLDGQEYNAMWVDESQPLFIANNPLHWKAHKLQLIVARLERQIEKNPAQFNASAYIGAVEKLGSIMDEIRSASGESRQILESGAMAEGDTERSGSQEVRQRESDGVDTRVSADNPFTR